MAGTDLARFEGPMAKDTLEVWRETAELAAKIANTDFVPKAFRNNPAAVTAAMLTGHELGLKPMAALGLIHVIEGRPGLSAEGMRTLIQSFGHEIWIDDNEYTATKVTVYGRRAGDDKVLKVTWTQDMVQTAGLAGKENHRKYPRQMKLARATGELARLMFADVIRGVPYAVEEMQDGLIFDEEEPAGELPAAEDKPKGITRKASPARKSAAARASAPPAAQASEPPLPPLPGEDEPASGSSPSNEEAKPEQAQLGEDPQMLERSKSIAIACQRAGLDDEGRHRLIGFVTNGRVASSKEVSAEEGADVLQTAHDIANGHARLIEGDDGWEVVYGFTPEDATGDGELVGGEESGWSGEQWRALLKERGVKVTATVQAAQRIAGELEVKPVPAALDQLAGQDELCRRLRAWVEEQSAG